MKRSLLETKLLAAARKEIPADRVPYAFEKRIMACLAGQKAPDALSLWGAALWRAALPCLAVAFIVFAWNMMTADENAFRNHFTQEFETAVMVSDQYRDTW